MPGLLGRISTEIQSWSGIIAATHWDLYRPTVPDGADFYIGETEIGHLHFYGEAHIASDRSLCERFIADGKAQPFRFRQDPAYRYWTQVTIANEKNVLDTIELFRANYERLRLKDAVTEA
jgi:hypothetical protein